MQTVLIAGASGVVGRRALDQLLASANVDRVIAVGRRALPMQHPKLLSQTADLNDQSDLVAKIPEQVDVAICCLGTTIKAAGSQEAFRRVDHDAVLTFAEAALAKGAQRFLLVSSIGANASSGTFYLRIKGETEADLAKLGFANLTILRPSFIDPQGERGDNRWGERLVLPAAQFVFSLVGKHGRYAPIKAETVGRALVTLAFDETSERVRILEGKKLFAAGE
ncbi:Semialdehyde dehydrogenase, NAD - binding protein [Candidatus Koribacter versatilis Ellin345]|uniref:Semialdehyde dehydrogenase, NAD-binding protein n=1 Tax=Koribacter versatilis (strain Ellin345) TaxID=204669 RepID=Q1IPC8_KORVE|nr:oxidoreductase [Candidatus Koribacter versatilis]ABF41272.1 Semialdehyde dehydrogenase, NAD - binding protein [Candidatus Koribacter versatilis Ellin345]